MNRTLRKRIDPWNPPQDYPGARGFFLQAQMLSAYLPDDGMKAWIARCRKCGSFGEPLTFAIAGKQFTEGAVKLALGNSKAIIVGDFEVVVHAKPFPGVTTTEMKLVGEPRVLTGEVEIKCCCGFVSRWRAGK
jgi:hypothetical protein